MKILKIFCIFLLFNLLSCSLVNEDKSVLIGKNSAGVSYYIKENKKPENKVYMQLVINVGSLQEDDDQQGLAHLLEHMAFNGTKSYGANEIVTFLESMGVEFGPELNAYTSYNETVYKLEIPTDKGDLVLQALNILKEWAFDISFEDSQIEKERKIVLEEARARKTAFSKAYEDYSKALFSESKYAHRFPIGKEDVIKSFTKERLVNFYKKWYTPKNMAIFIVGDINKNQIKEELEKFKPENTLVEYEKTPVDVPLKFMPKDLKFYSDKEFPQTNFSAFYRTKFNPLKKESDYKNYIAYQLASSILNTSKNKRINENKSDLLNFNCGASYYTNDLDIFIFTGTTETDKIESGWTEFKDYINTSILNITENGLEIAKERYLADITRLYQERNNYESINLLEWYKDDYLNGHTTISIETNYKIVKKLLKKIDVTFIQEVLAKILIDDNSLYVVTTSKDNSVKEKLNTILQSTTKSNPETDEIVIKDFWEKSLKSTGSIENKTYDKELKTTTLILDNGTKLILLPTKYKNDEVYFTGFSKGGLSLADDNKFYSASIADDLVNSSGLNNISATELKLFLSTHQVTFSTFINKFYEGFSGTSNKKNLEILFKLIYSYFTYPQIDEDIFNTVIKATTDRIKNMDNNPQEYFFNQVGDILCKNNLRERSWKVSDVKKVNKNDAINFFKDRFILDEWTFVLVGNFNISDVENYSKKYICNIEKNDRKENYNLELYKTNEENSINKTFYKGKEKKSMVEVIYSGKIDYTMENREKIYALSHIIDTTLREKIREEEKGAYITQGASSLSLIPESEFAVYMFFICDPEKAVALKNRADEELAKIAAGNFKEEYLKNYIEILKNQRKSVMQTNEFWLQALTMIEQNITDKINVLQREVRLDKLTSNDISDFTKSVTKSNKKSFMLIPE